MTGNFHIPSEKRSHKDLKQGVKNPNLENRLVGVGLGKGMGLGG